MGNGRLLTLVVAVALLVGCDSAPQPSNEKAHAENRSGAPFRRFEPAISTDGYGIALDTVTGRWCKAWDWTMHPTSLSLSGLNELPLCADIYSLQQYRVGDTVMLKGRKVKIQKIYPDDTFDYEEVSKGNP